MRIFKADIAKLENYSYESRQSNGTIWFGHYPSSTIVSKKALNEIIRYLIETFFKFFV